MTRWSLVVGLTLALVAPSPAVVLRYKLAGGEKMVYRDQMAMAFSGDGPKGDHSRLQFRSDSRVQQTVRKAEESGFTLDIENLSNKTTVTHDGGKTQHDDQLNPPERVRLTSRGKVLERKTMGKKDKSKDGEPSMGFCTKLDELDIVQQVFDGLMLPEGDVEPGAEWTDVIAVDLTPDDKAVRTPVEVKATAAFRRLVKVRGEECAEIETGFEVPLRTPKDSDSKQLNLKIDGTISGLIRSYFSVKRGRTIAETSTVGVVGKMTLAPDGGKSIKLGGRLKLNTKTVLED